VIDHITPQEELSTIEDLEPKMCLEGVVKKVELYGAFVDLGLSRDGLIHISQLSDQHIKKVTDVVQEGDRVTVWVKSVDAEKGRIGLTMLKPADVEWKDLVKGSTHTGRVTRIERYGVFVEFGAERPGLLHVREMGQRFVRHPSELFQEGDEVEIRILDVDRRRKRIDLTMVDLTETDYMAEEDDDVEPALTPMQIAFHRAQEEASERRRETSHGKVKHGRTQQEEIIARTLKQLGK
jgi:ribosomal protein S1